MCRLVGIISNQRIAGEYPLVAAPGSLLRLARINPKEIQKDGWGIGWFARGRPVFVKSPKPIYRDQERLRRAARQARGKVLIGHVRWASNPMKLPKKALIGLAHTQPFTYRNWLFAHNGTLLIPREVRAALGSLAGRIKGNNDSEVLFYWLMKHLLPSPRRKPGSRRLDWVPAYAGMTTLVARIRKSISELHKIWQGCRKKYPLYKYPYHGLNWVLSDGKMLIAMCYVNPGGFGKSNALRRPSAPYYQLHFKRDSEGWVVASEPLDDDPRWKPFRHGELLIAGPRQGRFYQL